MSAHSPPAARPRGLLAGPEARAFGVLLHPTSLPGPGPIGTIGQPARDFVDWLAAAGARWWQTLPLTLPGGGNSPYASPSSLAGNHWLLDLNELHKEGLLTDAEVTLSQSAEPNLVDFAAVHDIKRRMLALAADRLLALPAAHPMRQALQRWRMAEPWSLDVAWFLAYRERVQYQPWWQWPRALRRREPAALQRVRLQLQAEIDRQLVWQFLFDRQWQALRHYAREREIRLLGDVPMYVDADSADTWCYPAGFALDASGAPLEVAGVPPDYFSDTGQRWGNPLYRWEAHKKTGFAWWIRRLQRSLRWSDALRIDHFRGLTAYWAIAAAAPDAINGEWRQGPGRSLLEALGPVVGEQLVAEDLGVIDAEVLALRDGAGLPGMAVLQFAFGSGPANSFLPHNHVANSVVYPGTHDNDTSAGWWQTASAAERAHVQAYTGTIPMDDAAAARLLCRLALGSVSRLAVLPVQDLLALPSAARLNKPGTADGNWTFRLAADALDAPLAATWRDLAGMYGRVHSP